MTVKYRRPEYRNLLPTWTMIRDVVSGPASVKSKGEVYLPRPNPSDKSQENKDRFKSYVDRAQLYPATTQTLRGLIGQVFLRESTIELPSILLPLEESVDGGELNLEQQAKEAVSECLSLGHGLLFIDYPDVESASRRDITSGLIRPVILQYKAEQIINWRWTYHQGRRLLSLLVLEEEYDSDDDGYEITKDIQWRVLSLEMEDENGQPVEPYYVSKIYRESDEGMYESESYVPRMGDGSLWGYIPVAFFGSENNDPLPDTPPLEGIAHINIGHYRNSADYEESCYMVGQPTPWASGLTEDWVSEVWKGQINLGSRSLVPLPEGGSAGLLQAQPNTMCKEAMEHKERQMVALGAKLVEQASVQRTATEVNGENVVENSTLSNVARNVTMAYQKAILMCQEYLNISDKFEFKLNSDFEIANMNPQERAQLMAEWQGGSITWEEYRHSLKRIGVAWEEDSLAKRKAEAELENSIGLGEEDDGQEED